MNYMPLEFGEVLLDCTTQKWKKKKKNLIITMVIFYLTILQEHLLISRIPLTDSLLMVSKSFAYSTSMLLTLCL